MIRAEPNYREIADAVTELDEQITALQDSKKDIYAKLREDHGKKIADQVKLAIKLNSMDGDKRMERDEVEEGAFRILAILQAPRAPRATRSNDHANSSEPSSPSTDTAGAAIPQPVAALVAIHDDIPEFLRAAS